MQKAILFEEMVCKVSEKIAEKSANSACSGFFFQEKIPESCMIKYKKKE